MSGNGSLKSLHTTLIDAEKGYQTAIADAEAGDIRALFQRIAAAHASAHADVHAILIARGERPDESGSILSLVHKTVISVRSAVAGLNRASLPSFITGEERIVEAYDRAITEAANSREAVATLQRDRDTVLVGIKQMKAMAA